MTVRIAAGDVELAVDPDDGGRWVSWRIGGVELLSGAEVEGMPRRYTSGCFPMAPFAGRVRHGRVAVGGAAHQLPLDDPPHAIHGTVAGMSWTVAEQAQDAVTLAVDLQPPWPARGRVEQRLALRPDRLDTTLTVTAVDAMPVTIGWHPWFARRLPTGGDAVWEVRGGRQYERDDKLPTGELVPPAPGPWDDCFRDFDEPPALRWPGALRLQVRSSGDHFVLFDELPDVRCLEPQSGPPDAQRLGEAQDLEAGESASLRCTWSWTADDGD